MFKAFMTESAEGKQEQRVPKLFNRKVIERMLTEKEYDEFLLGYTKAAFTHESFVPRVIERSMTKPQYKAFVERYQEAKSRRPHRSGAKEMMSQVLRWLAARK